jgi:hypothetical protein
VLPANFPADIPVPPEYKVDEVQTEPFLKVVGRATPPNPGRAAYGAVHDALVANLTERGWTLEFAPRSEGADGAHVIMTHPDGRNGRYRSQSIEGCVGEVLLTYELNWVTP